MAMPEGPQVKKREKGISQQVMKAGTPMVMSM
jgi:hypothetical protein